MNNSKREELLAVLFKEQKDKGGLSREVLENIARSMGLSTSEVFGVASFYSFFALRPLGKYVIRVCKSLPCYYKNSELIIEVIREKLGIGPGETTPDGRFSLELTNCIGACDSPPAMLINDTVYKNLNADKVRQVLDEYLEEGVVINNNP